jgi:hypothetical protein
VNSAAFAGQRKITGAAMLVTVTAAPESNLLRDTFINISYFIVDFS